MTKIKVWLIALLITAVGGNVAMAQDEVSDEEIRKYAILDQVVLYMKKDISVELNKMIKAQEGIDGKRYSELAATKGDEAKLAAAGVTDFEKQFLSIVDNMKEERIDAIKVVNSALATKMVGDKGKTYKKIKAELKTDEALKARYAAILAEVKGE